MSPIQIEFNCLAVGQYQCFLILRFAKGFFFGGSAAVMSTKKRPPMAKKEEEAVRLPGLSPQAAEGAKGNLAISVTRVNPSADKKRPTCH